MDRTTFWLRISTKDSYFVLDGLPNPLGDLPGGGLLDLQNVRMAVAVGFSMYDDILKLTATAFATAFLYL